MLALDGLALNFQLAQAPLPLSAQKVCQTPESDNLAARRDRLSKKESGPHGSMRAARYCHVGAWTKGVSGPACPRGAEDYSLSIHGNSGPVLSASLPS